MRGAAISKVLSVCGLACLGGCVEEAWAQPRQGDAGRAVARTDGGPRRNVDALGALLGDRIGDSFGFGGLGRGSLASGVPSDRGTIGLGNLGSIGRGGGAGRGDGVGLGSGSGGFRPRSSQAVSVVVDGVTARARGLDAEVVRRVLARQRAAFAYCAASTNAMPVAGGLTALVRFVVGVDGAVAVPSVDVRGVPALLTACLGARIRGLAFPAPADHATVPVALSMTFSRG